MCKKCDDLKVVVHVDGRVWCICYLISDYILFNLRTAFECRENRLEMTSENDCVRVQEIQTTSHVLHEIYRRFDNANRVHTELRFEFRLFVLY